MDAKLRLHRTDCESIVAHLQHQDKLLQLKRRWLMGLHVSKSKKKFLKQRSLPESLLRKDDVFCEIAKNHVVEALGAHNGESGHDIFQENKQMFSRSNLKCLLLSSLDAFTNKGLLLLAMVLTKGSVSFEKTRPKMKKVIKESVSRVLGDQDHNVQIEIFTQLSQLLKDPQNVQYNRLIPKFYSHHVSAIKIVDKLEDLSSETLLAMRKKLRGVPVGTPRLQRKKLKRGRDKLIYKVRRTSQKMLSELRAGDDLQASLVKALAVAGLSLKLTTGYSNFFVEDFNQFSPEIKRLQNKILKAIWLLKTKVRLPELKAMQCLLDPNSNISNRSLRTAMKKLLTEYLFECSDLDKIPKSLLKALAIVNRSSRNVPNRCFMEEEIEEEVECILNVSAQLRQIIWDLHPQCEFDQDFTDAYMEDLEESDDGADDDNNYHDKNVVAATGVSSDDVQQLKPRKIPSSRTYSIDLDNPEESCGEYVPGDSNVLTFTAEGSSAAPPFQEKRHVDDMLNVDVTWFEAESMAKFGTSRINENDFLPHLSSNGRLNSIPIKGNKPVHSTEVNSGHTSGLLSSSCCIEEVKFMSNEQSSHTNIYLGVQEVCDETSMVACKLIGNIMEKFAQEEGIDLDWSDRSYLRYSTQEKNERWNCSERDEAGLVIVQVVEEIMPSLPKSGMEKLKELIGIV